MAEEGTSMSRISIIDATDEIAEAIRELAQLELEPEPTEDAAAKSAAELAGEPAGEPDEAKEAAGQWRHRGRDEVERDFARLQQQQVEQQLAARLVRQQNAQQQEAQLQTQLKYISPNDEKRDIGWVHTRLSCLGLAQAIGGTDDAVLNRAYRYFRFAVYGETGRF
jgi:hypothetical protein